MSWSLTVGSATIPLQVMSDSPARVKPRIVVQNPVGSVGSINTWINTPSPHRILTGKVPITGNAVSHSNVTLSPATMSVLPPSVGYNQTWLNPNNAKVADGVYATWTPTDYVSSYLSATNFGAAIPSDNVIFGILAEARLLDPTQLAYENVVKLLINSNPVGNNNIAIVPVPNPGFGGYGRNWPATLQYVGWGSSSDVWGLPLTPSIVNSSTFGFTIQAGAYATGYAWGGAIGVPPQPQFSNVASVDHMRLTIYYGTIGVAIVYYVDVIQILQRNASAVTLTDDKGISGSYYIARSRFSREQNIAPIKYSLFELELIKNG